MAFSLTVSICDILDSRILYCIYFTAIDYFQVGWIIIQPKVFINGFGHENLILIHGLIKLLGVNYIRTILIFDLFS